MARRVPIAILVALICCPALSNDAYEDPFISPCRIAEDGSTDSQLPTPILDYCQVIDEDAPIGQSQYAGLNFWLDAVVPTQKAVLLVTGVVP